MPTGIRILFGTANDANGNPVATWAGQIELVQQPEDYNAGTFVSTTAPATLNFSAVDFLGGATYPGQIDEATVEAGDYFTSSGHAPHRINQVSGTPPGVQSIQLDSALTQPLTPGTQYAIVRGPRRLPSEDIISFARPHSNLPPNIVIDNTTVQIPGSASTTTLCQNLPLRTLLDSSNPQGIQVAEIVFAPSGALVGQGTGAGQVFLWLRDPSLLGQKPPANGTQATVGAPLIVSIQIRTGLISVYPVATWAVPTDDPYAAAKAGHASGM